jgi:hypothetical protein
VNWRKSFNLVFAALFVLSLLPAVGLAQGAQSAPQAAANIEAALLDKLATDHSAAFFVVMAGRADLSKASEIEDWSARGWYVYNALRDVANRSQGPVIEYAEKNGLAYESYLTTDSVFIEQGTRTAVEEIAALPGVELVRLPKVAYIDPLAQETAASPNTYGWNLGTLDPAASQYGMQAAQVWSQYGVKGEGIVVANIDTGVYYQHEALDRQYRGNLTGNIGGPYNHNFNWYMPTSGCGDGTAPCDNNGHGSGTAGIMVGETANLVEQVGVAPEAQWIACKGCETSSCSEAALTGCADWIVAPCAIGDDPGDPSCDPDMRPNIVNNSWGGGGCDTWYQGYVQAWVASGIFPAFSAGNDYTCNSLGSPGDNPEAFGTAAHDSSGNNLYAGGPSCFFPTPSCDPHAHQVDPHLNAPTYGRTSGNTAGAYYNLSGTSGASPHTAGAVALLWSGNPAYLGQIEDTFYILEQSTNHNVPAGDCGKPACAGSNVYPNYEYGWGYLDALGALTMAGVGGQGWLDGHVHEGTPLNAPGDPLPGITIRAERQGGGSKQVTTDATGYYTTTLVAGTYTVTASSDLYTGQTVTGIVVVTDTLTTQDFNLLPKGLLDGYVTDADSGAPLEATVAADDGTTAATNPSTGYYEMYLDAGTYDVTAEATDYASQTLPVDITAGGTTQQDFQLLAAIAVVPDPIHATVELFGTGDVGAVMTNNMQVDYPFQFIEVEGGMAKSQSPEGSGGPDPFGYTYKDSNEPAGARYDWIDATDGTALDLADDGEANVTLPFSFNFYGALSTDLRVGNNGGALFGVTTGDLSVANADLGTTTASNLIVPFWDDIDSDTGNVYYKTVGTAPHRLFVVEWYNRPHFSNVGSATFELILYESTNNIKFQYQDVVFDNASYDYGASATVGIRQTGNNYLQYSYNSPVLADAMSICYQYPGSPPCDGGNVLWFGTSITGGTVPAGGDLDWTNYFTATPDVGIDQPGDYQAQLIIAPAAQSRDGLPTKYVPVVLTVLPTATLGKLDGTVTSNRPGGPLEAEILIEASGGTTYTLTTDPATGAYAYWLEAGTYAVTASADGYVSQTVQVDVVAGMTTTQDFELALFAPWIGVTPPTLEEALDFGATAVQNLTIANNGLQPLDFEILEIPGSGPMAKADRTVVYGVGQTLEGEVKDATPLYSEPGHLDGSGGPDAFGYTFKDSFEPDGPRYEFVDISATGTPVSLQDDAYGGPFPIGFPFNFYGGDYSDFYIGSNGFLSFGAGSTSLSNQCPLPSSTTPNNLIALMWDDLDPGDTSDLVYYQSFPSCPYGGGACLVVHYNNFHHYPGGGTLAGTWEAILFDNGSILIQFEDVGAEAGSGSTTGIENSTGTVGLTYACDTASSLSNQSAVCFIYPDSAGCGAGDVPWLMEDPISGTVPAAGSLDVQVTFDAGAVPEPGTYTAELFVVHNDPLAGAVVVPVTMTVNPTADIGKLEGTVTSDRPGGPLEADILIENSGGMTWTATTDPATGYYYRWLPVGDYTVTASADGYLPGQAQATIVGMATTVRDFQLVRDAPEIGVSPLTMGEELVFGSTASQNLEISNTGAADLLYELQEVDMGGPAAAGEGVQVTIPESTVTFGPGAKVGPVTNATRPAISFVVPAVAPRLVGFDVLLLTPDQGAGGDISLILTTLATFPDLNVTLWDSTAGDPSGTDLAPYDVVIVGNDYLWTAGGMTAVGVGNALADYIDAGGKVIDTLFLHDWAGWQLDGRYIIDGYAPFTASTTDLTSLPYTMGTVYDPGHPLMSGVTSITDNPATIGIGHQDVGLAPGATRLADWNDGEIFIAYNDNVVGINQLWYHGSGWSGDVPTLMHNAIAYLSGGAGGGEVPWLAEFPISGTVAPGDTGTVLVTFDAGQVPQPGTYLADLNVNSNDPYNEQVTVAVSMTVLPSTDMGKLEGLITGLGYCDQEEYPLEADILIESSTGMTWTVTSDPATGYYYRWLLAGDYSVTASAADHRPGTADVQITAGQTSTLDLALRWLAPCMDVAPTSFDVNVAPDSQLVQTLSIDNSGASDLTWELKETTATVGIQVNMVTGNASATVVPTILPAGESPFGDAGHRVGPPAVQAPADPNTDVALVIDDGTSENALGLTAGGQFIWLNRFTPDPALFPFVLEEVQHYFYSGQGVSVGDVFDVYIYEDTDGDGDPGTGAVFLGDIQDVTAQALDTWSVWPLATPVVLNGPGDVLIAVVNRTTVAPGTYPATMDQTASQQRSWVGAYTGNPGDPPTLPADNLWGIVDSFGFPGNWMVRGYGQTGSGQVWIDVPWVSEVPTAGVTLADSTFAVDVTFDSTGLTLGECYTASLGLLHDDPGQPVPFMIPLRLCVTCTQVTAVDLTVVTAGPVHPGDQVDFSATMTPHDMNMPFSYSIDMGDGSAPVEGTSSDDPMLFNHTFALPGTYTVQISVMNCDMVEPVVNSVEVAVTEPFHYVYLPIISKNATP